MKEIKFRAWDKERKEMLDVIRIEFVDGKANEVETKNGLLGVDTECILLEYTGIEDKDKVEVYDGDIIEKYHYEQPNNQISDRFLNGPFEVKWIVRGYCHECSDIVGFDNVARNCKVIGNIYENPDLIKK